MTPFQNLLEELMKMSRRALNAYGEDTTLAESIGACIQVGILDKETAAKLVNVSQMRALLDEIDPGYAAPEDCPKDASRS